MKKNRNTYSTNLAPQTSQANSISNRNRRSKKRWGISQLVIALVLLLALGQMVLLGSLTSDSSSPSTSKRGYGAAAVATQPPRVSNELDFVLPDTKEEAYQFERQHNSPFNFDTLKKLRQGETLTLEKQQKAENLPKPTEANFSSSPPLTPKPTRTNGTGDGPRLAAYTPDPTRCTAIISTDTFEPDNTSNLARNITVGLRQTHTLPVISDTDPPTNGDIDWVRFRIGSVSQVYTIETLNLLLNPDVDTIIQLYKGDATSATTLIASNDDVGTDPRSRILYTPQDGDDASNVFFYVQIYGAPNRGCPGRYDISVTTGPVPTATSTALPSPTQPDFCRDIYEDDGVPARAKELRVSYGVTPPFGATPGVPNVDPTNKDVQSRFICPKGDQDWAFVELVKGKPYSIFTTNLANGLDTLLILFEEDAKGNLKALYSSDDFPGMALASRIDFVVPATPTTPTGEYRRYYVMVKDVSNKGLINLSYALVLTSPGDGKNDCIDNFEPDGLQYLAKEILINETQSRVLCPNTDADWVRFFAKTGRTYNLKTSFTATPGLDTYMFVFSLVFDPNDKTKVVSQREIGTVRNDVGPSDLSSTAEFTVPVDGIYYAQIKNEGDIGRPGLYYQLAFTVAGASPVAPTTAPTQGSSFGTSTAIAATATAIAIAETATVQRRQTLTAVPTLASVANPSPLLSLKFADPSFQRLWYYNDLPVAQNQVQRSWEWGPKPGVSQNEAYNEAPSQERQVQYFDKSRMEINNPKGDRGSQWFVSNGLLVREMITGQIAKGQNSFEQRAPANLQLAGDLSPDNVSPTYARFASLITNGDNNRVLDQTGQTVKQGLAADGSIWTLNAPPEALKLVAYIKETGHNLPQVFYDYMQSAGKIYDGGFKDGALRNWVFAMGYPLSEPYWIKARVGGIEKDILVQVFERRVLTYTPSNTPEWRVEMANVGQHYYLWRYNRNLYAE